MIEGGYMVGSGSLPLLLAILPRESGVHTPTASWWLVNTTLKACTAALFDWGNDNAGKFHRVQGPKA